MLSFRAMLERYGFRGLPQGFCFFLVVLCVSSAFTLSVLGQERVTIRVDAAKKLGPLNPVWTYFGYDEPNYTYTPRGHELISELVALSPVPVYIRTHNLLTTGNGTPALKWGSTNAYTEDASGRAIYDWKIVDQILDTYVHSGAKPFVEIGFMPEALSANPEPYQHNWPKGKLDTGWAYPPKDYAKWAELVRQLVLHCAERYGESEVATWYFEVWNEPDIFYWHGTPEEYDKLYDFSADAVKRAMPAARVGGPATTGPAYPKAAAFLQQFLEHCARGKNFATEKTGAPLDFISFHAKGSPKVVEGHVELALAVRDFVKRLPPVKTEREWMRDRMLEQAKARNDRASHRDHFDTDPDRREADRLAQRGENRRDLGDYSR